MSGKVPPTSLLLTRSGHILAEFDSLLGVALFLKVDITDDGVIMFEGEPQNPTYSIGENQNSWEKVDAIIDWLRHHFPKHKQYKIYRVLSGS